MTTLEKCARAIDPDMWEALDRHVERHGLNEEGRLNEIERSPRLARSLRYACSVLTTLLELDDGTLNAGNQARMPGRSVDDNTRTTWRLMIQHILDSGQTANPT